MQAQHRRLDELVARIVAAPLGPVEGAVRISGVHDDSRAVQPGGLFVAIPGTRADGRQYIDDAVRRGAAAIVGEDIGAVSGAVVLPVEDARSALAQLAWRWYGLDRSSSSCPRLIGVTGTNGKTTVTTLVCAMLRHAGRRCGLLGTVAHDLAGAPVVAHMTTPGPLELGRLLAQCAANGAEWVVMEVSSHALDQRRVAGLAFAAAGFTNLTQDHLDYHRTMERYAAAKARLFAQVAGDGVAVVNRDDPHCREMVRCCGARVVTYALDQAADLTAAELREAIDATRYRLRIAGHIFDIETPLVGRHNVYNGLAAAGLALAAGVEPREIVAVLAAPPAVRGRLQRVPSGGGFEVFIDYAHTDDALRNVGGALRRLARGRLIIVFGCGGDRDRTKRPRMAKAAADCADVIIITSDNPRGEDPRAIIDDMLAGLDAAERRRTIVEPDRRAAIFLAVREARPGDVVLLAGKGHERCQIVGERRIAFDDDMVAREALAARGQPGKAG